MKININLAEECYPLATISFNAEYCEDYSANNKDWFNVEIPNDILEKWIKAFLAFEQAQEEIANYFGDSYHPNFCEFDSVKEIK